MVGLLKAPRDLKGMVLVQGDWAVSTVNQIIYSIIATLQFCSILHCVKNNVMSILVPI